MTEYQLRQRINQLEKQLETKKQDIEYKKEVVKSARQIKILFDEFEKQGISKEFAQAIILKTIK